MLIDQACELNNGGLVGLEGANLSAFRKWLLAGPILKEEILNEKLNFFFFIIAQRLFHNHVLSWWILSTTLAIPS